MIQSVNLSMSEQRPLQLTTSLVSPEQVNLSLYDYLSSGAFDFVIPAVKYQQSDQEFFYFDVDKYVSLLEILQGNAGESAIDTAITTLIFALNELEKSGVNIDLVNIFPQYIFLDPANYAAKVVIVPVRQSEPSDFRKFFEELLSVLPFTPGPNTKLSLLQDFLTSAPLFTIHSLADALFNPPAGDPVMFPDSVLQSDSSVASEGAAAGVEPPSNAQGIAQASAQPSAQPSGQSGDLPNEQPDAQVMISSTQGSVATQVASLTNMSTGLVSRISHFPFVIGRHPKLADLLLSSPHISGEHARIECVNGQFQIADMRSTNGVYTNSVRVSSSGPARIEDGDVITLADLNFTFHTGR
jgi:hypothetical protein